MHTVNKSDHLANRCYLDLVMYYSVVQAMNISYWKNTKNTKLLMICSSVNQYILTINANLLKHDCIHSTLKTLRVHIISTLKKENLSFIAENNYSR